jgi:CBS-domain-containing membrane protein
MLIAPFAASATILFGFNQVPAARPKNFVFGHLISSVVGLVMMSFFPGSWIAACVAAGLSIAMMLFTDTGHPPAAGDPILIWASQASWSFLAVPILPAIVLLLGLNWLYLRATRPTH